MTDLSPEDKARIEAEERERESVRKRIKAEDDAKQRQKTNKGCFVGCVIIFAIAILIFAMGAIRLGLFGGGSPSDQSATEQPPEPSQNAPSNPSQLS